MAHDLASITTGPSTPLPSATSPISSFTQQGDWVAPEDTPCYPPCEVAAYHANGIGPTPELCDEEETAFISAYENCAACIQASGNPSKDFLKPEIRQALDYCDIEVSFTSKSVETDEPTLSAATESEEDSSATSTSSPTETSDNSGSESSDEGDADDSSGNPISALGPALCSIASIVFFGIL